MMGLSCYKWDGWDGNLCGHLPHELRSTGLIKEIRINILYHFGRVEPHTVLAMKGMLDDLLIVLGSLGS